MRKGLFLSALLASLFISGAAMADRNGDDDSNSKSNTRGMQIKEQVLEKQRELRTKTTKESRSTTKSNKAVENRLARTRPHGDVYGDQATRSTTKSTVTTASGRNMSATSSVNTPREIKSMLSRINPMYGAYRVSEAAEATDSYGGTPSNVMKQSNGQTKNLSATGSVNTPAEIKQMLLMINPMHGAYRTSQASEGTDSYGGSMPFATGSTRANVSAADNMKRAAQKNEKLRENINNIVKSKMEKAR